MKITEHGIGIKFRGKEKVIKENGVSKITTLC
jgi:hypothetical protein